jgi:hypothetical protein
MRYLITSKRSDTQVTLGYDERGLLNEVLITNAADVAAIEYTFRHAPIREEEVKVVFNQPHLVFTTLNVSFLDFWVKYNNKEGKKDAERAWSRMSAANQQLAFNYIQRYRDACMRDRKHIMYPATYLRAERWLDHT